MYKASGDQLDGAPHQVQLSQAMVLNCGNRLLLVGYAPFIEDSTSLVGLDSLLHSQLAKDWQLKITIIGKLIRVMGLLSVMAHIETRQGRQLGSSKDHQEVLGSLAL